MNQWMESFMVYNCFTGVCRVGEYIVFYGEHWNRASSCLHSCSWSCGLGRDHGVPFAKAYFTGEGPGFFHKTLFIPILLHGLYDCFLFTAVEISNSVPEGHEISDKDSGVILFCFLMFLFTLSLSLRMVYKYLREMRAKQDVKTSDS